MIDIERIRAIVALVSPPSHAYQKAFRAICFLMKATTSMSQGFRPVKENEKFEKWDRI